VTEEPPAATTFLFFFRFFYFFYSGLSSFFSPTTYPKYHLTCNSTTYPNEDGIKHLEELLKAVELLDPRSCVQQ
jgi:hypothetical protein